MSDIEDVSNSLSSATEEMDEVINGVNGDNNNEDTQDNDNATGGSSLEADFQEVLDRLDNVEITADLDMIDMNAEDVDTNGLDENTPEDSRSVSAESSASDNSKESKSSKSSKSADKVVPDSTQKEEKVKRSITPGKGSSKSSSSETKISKSSSVFSRLKRLTKFDKSSKSKPEKQTGLSDVKIDRLPQVFVAKYLGKYVARGIHGLQYVRKPVDKLVGSVKKELGENDTVELPLVYVVISGQGIDIREHRANKLKDQANLGLIPIDFVSYGVQDIKYWRVFTFIVVKQMSSRSKDMKHECHAVLCDSSTSARKMALSLGASFGVYKKKLNKEGKTHNFTVELRPPDELAEAYAKEYEA